MNTIHYNEIKNKIKASHCIKQKRERAVYTDGNFYYKVWVPNWQKGDITKAGVDNGFYDTSTTPALESLIYDESGQRGYIMKVGNTLCRSGDSMDWSGLVDNISLEMRKDFILNILNKSLVTKGIHLDLSASNVVMIDNKLSLIDLESFGSFGFVFDAKKEWYEKFELDAWYKPLETAQRDLDKFYKAYLIQCLNISYLNKIDSENSVREIIDLIMDNK